MRYQPPHVTSSHALCCMMDGLVAVTVCIFLRLCLVLELHRVIGHHKDSLWKNRFEGQRNISQFIVRVDPTRVQGIMVKIISELHAARAAGGGRRRAVEIQLTQRALVCS
ncbi:hypothetical protein EVAR_55806_1 [Eumeta japonica]|uniref:Uncharacterized protein n=1 Tax=Eumeta variegata TaxID=151549 RepID=A0A4C1YVD9_EUMVA|nr:hypothetical protein EVAR_55806_1 [Eumeta japonica]